MAKMSEEKGLELLAALIAKPEAPAAEIPRIWQEIMGVYDAHYAPPAPPPEPVRKKRRKKVAVANPNLGWPKGIKRADYLAWREAQHAKGVTEGINPQAYARVLGGATNGAPAAAPPAAEALATKAKGKATETPPPAAATEEKPKTRARAAKAEAADNGTTASGPPANGAHEATPATRELAAAGAGTTTREPFNE